MRGFQGLGRRAWAGAAACAAVLAAAAPAAADDCPNAAIRAQQGSARLPDCRAFELVSPVAKNGNAVSGLEIGTDTGGNLIFRANGAFAGAQSSMINYYRATRGQDGWATTALNFPTHGRPSISGDEPTVAAVSRDLSRVAFNTKYPVDDRDTGVVLNRNTNSADVYGREPDGSFTFLSHGDGPSDASSQPVTAAGASADMRRVVLATRRPLTTPIVDESLTRLYIREGDAVRLVSVGEDGVPLTDNALSAKVSDDGETILFQAGGRLYLRMRPLDPVAAQTRQLGAPSGVSGCTYISPIGLSPDGATVVLLCMGELLPGGPEAGVYRYDVAADRYTLLLEDRPTFGPIAVSRDLTRIYFTSMTPHVPGAADPTINNTYLLRDGRVTFVADRTPIRGPVMSPDGDHLVFWSDNDLGYPTNGLRQIYKYDARDGSLVCASCRADGSPSEGEARLTAISGQLGAGSPFGNVSADGRYAFFSSADSLVPEDLNGVADAYEYVDGRPHLLTSGVDPLPSMFAGASLDGSEAYVVTSDRLAADDIDNGVNDLYAARVNGGFERQAPPAPCISDCRGPLRPPVTATPPGSFLFTGPGDEDDRIEPPSAKVLSVLPVGAAARKTWARTGRLSLRLRLSDAGRVRAVVRGKLGRARRGVTVASASRRVTEGGAATLTLRLSRRARSELRRRGALRVTVRVTWSEGRGAHTTSFVLRAARRGARR